MATKHPSVWALRDLVRHASDGECALINGRWVPARPEGFASFWNRLRAAWLVFTGRADAVTWEGQ